MFNIGNTIILFSTKIQYCINNIGPCYFTVVPMWLKSYHDTGPEGTFLPHLVHHRTLSKTLVTMAKNVLHNTGNMCICDLSDMYALNPRAPATHQANPLQPLPNSSTCIATIAKSLIVCFYKLKFLFSTCLSSESTQVVYKWPHHGWTCRQLANDSGLHFMIHGAQNRCHLSVFGYLLGDS